MISKAYQTVLLIHRVNHIFLSLVCHWKIHLPPLHNFAHFIFYITIWEVRNEWVRWLSANTFKKHLRCHVENFPSALHHWPITWKGKLFHRRDLHAKSFQSKENAKILQKRHFGDQFDLESFMYGKMPPAPDEAINLSKCAAREIQCLG